MLNSLRSWSPEHTESRSCSGGSSRERSADHASQPSADTATSRRNADTAAQGNAHTGMQQELLFRVLTCSWQARSPPRSTSPRRAVVNGDNRSVLEKTNITTVAKSKLVEAEDYKVSGHAWSQLNCVDYSGCCKIADCTIHPRSLPLYAH